MKTKLIIVGATWSLLVLTGLVSISVIQTQKLKQQYLSQGLLSSQLHYKTSGFTFRGDSLVLYDVSHSEYPSLMARRLQITNNNNVFKLSIQGVYGSIVRSFQQTEPYAIKHRILLFNPVEDLLLQPMIALSILGYDWLSSDIAISAERLPNNQILCNLVWQEHGKLKAHFVSKMELPDSQKSLVENLEEVPIPFHISYLDPQIKQKLDAYTQSKGLPFVTQTQQLMFQLPM